MGLKSNPSRDLLEKQSSPERILASIPNMESKEFRVCGSVNQYFFRILERSTEG